MAVTKEAKAAMQKGRVEKSKSKKAKLEAARARAAVAREARTGKKAAVTKATPKKREGGLHANWEMVMTYIFGSDGEFGADGWAMDLLTLALDLLCLLRCSRSVLKLGWRDSDGICAFDHIGFLLGLVGGKCLF
ncbi:hypothetical protein MBM_02546 [Drepanopeziza brunnea f. sp. 'multigermtubi' MB_m1]|uniref:Uncharacterized protein n=1 Tax=Marssonina brunnea f. sp. multigermtubi (strain MB_m1) TaxID=1072389 RepID=K1Y2C8_MARBU|nr:uncharacterized protein MBM_02546 [Drepanopeziza brunnea f. sp. 'multigermtubi' MB_m1]EKD19309.1 hypothetical protein MBM_02546 [Drepanopeziza brunnea f. sp. 'multigermtubi' MB_m1]